MITNPPIGTIVWRVCWHKGKPLLEQAEVKRHWRSTEHKEAREVTFPSERHGWMIEPDVARDGTETWQRYATSPEEAIRQAFAEQTRSVKEARDSLLLRETQLNKLATLKAKLDQHQAPKP